MKKLGDEIQFKARQLFLKGVAVPDIAEMLGIKVSTVHAWRRRNDWKVSGAAEVMRQVPEVIQYDTKAIVKALPHLEMVSKFEPLLDVEETLGRNRKITLAVQAVNAGLISELQNRLTLSKQGKTIDWTEYGKLLEITARVNKATLEQELYLHQLAADRAIAVTKNMTTEELEAIVIDE